MLADAMSVILSLGLGSLLPIALRWLKAAKRPEKACQTTLPLNGDGDVTASLLPRRAQRQCFDEPYSDNGDSILAEKLSSASDVASETSSGSNVNPGETFDKETVRVPTPESGRRASRSRKFQFTDVALEDVERDAIRDHSTCSPTLATNPKTTCPHRDEDATVKIESTMPGGRRSCCDLLHKQIEAHISARKDVEGRLERSVGRCNRTSARLSRLERTCRVLVAELNRLELSGDEIGELLRSAERDDSAEPAGRPAGDRESLSDDEWTEDFWTRRWTAAATPERKQSNDFELTSDVMEAILKRQTVSLSEALNIEDFEPARSESPERESGPEQNSSCAIKAEISCESIGDTQRTKRFWEEKIASDGCGPRHGRRTRTRYCSFDDADVKPDTPEMVDSDESEMQQHSDVYEEDDDTNSLRRQRNSRRVEQSMLGGDGDARVRRRRRRPPPASYPDQDVAPALSSKDDDKSSEDSAIGSTNEGIGALTSSAQANVALHGDLATAAAGRMSNRTRPSRKRAPKSQEKAAENVTLYDESSIAESCHGRSEDPLRQGTATADRVLADLATKKYSEFTSIASKKDKEEIKDNMRLDSKVTKLSNNKTMLPQEFRSRSRRQGRNHQFLVS